MGEKYVKATTVETVNIANKLREVATSANGFCDYQAGWDDARVAREAAPRLNANHVAHVRKQLFGSVRPPPDPQTPEKMLERLARLESGLRDLQADVAGILQKLQSGEPRPAAPPLQPSFTPLTPPGAPPATTLSEVR